MDDFPQLEETIFSEAITLPPAERRGFVARRCGNDSASVGRVMALLEGYENNSDFLESPPAATAHREARGLASQLPPDPAPGDRIGRYHLVERIGEGGFGVVYMAEQEEPVRRRVALKIIRLGLDTREFIARFEAERQAMALMDHPNIARVFDAGATATGRPYLVMELVRGVPITRYCDAHNLNLPARLALFARVCDGIQHAHQKGVVHRDLKPSNILVADDADSPTPKVIDFGIAKATRDPLTDKTLFTQYHILIGTPAYTSPEQMEPGGRDVDTRSDVYSLGVLLYELLSGRQPFDPGTLQRANFEELRRIIREAEPPRPSACITTLSAADRAAIAARRGVEPARLSALLRSDLDWIVMRCLEKDRARRYETPNALALDIRRYLEHEPVVARPPSRRYQLRKFVRRHRTGVATAIAIMVSLAGGLVASSILLGRARVAERAQAESRRRAEASAASARVEAAKSEQVARFMTDMLNGVAPGVARGRDTTLLSEIVDKTARRLDSELREQPAIAAKLRDMLGIVYHDLGQYEKAEALLRAAVATRRSLPDGAGADLASSLHTLGKVLRRLNRNVEAEAVLRESLEIRRRVLGPEHLEVAATLFDLSSPIGDLGRLEEYEALRRESLEIRRRLLGDEHPDVAESRYGLGSVARIKGNLAEAEALFREALMIRRKALGAEHPRTAQALNSLGFVLQGEDKWPEAISAYREALSIRRRVLGETHPDTCVTLLRLVGLLPAVGRHDEAVAIARDALAAQRSVSSEDAIETAPTLLALAALLETRGGDAGESKNLTQTARRLFEHARSTNERASYQANISMYFFAATMLRSGTPAAGLVMADEASQALTATFGPDHEEALSAIVVFAELQLAMGNIDQAIRRLEQVRERATGALPSSHQTVLRCLLGLGTAYRETDRVADSQRVLEEACVLLDAAGSNAVAPPPGDITKEAAQCQLALTLERQGDFAEAERLLRQVVARIGTRPEQPVILARAKSVLGAVLTRRGQFPEAEPFVTQGWLGLQEHEHAIPGDRGKELREAIERVVRLYLAWEKPRMAAAWRTKLANSDTPAQGNAPR